MRTLFTECCSELGLRFFKTKKLFVYSGVYFPFYETKINDPHNTRGFFFKLEIELRGLPWHWKFLILEDRKRKPLILDDIPNVSNHTIAVIIISKYFILKLLSRYTNFITLFNIDKTWLIWIVKV